MPTYISNYYYALKGAPNYGGSSCHYCTGTVAWMLLVILEELLGIKATTRGLVIAPHLPKDWENVTCTRKFREATYHVTFTKDAHEVKVNGEVYHDMYLPYEPGKAYVVEA